MFCVRNVVLRLKLQIIIYYSKQNILSTSSATLVGPPKAVEHSWSPAPVFGTRYVCTVTACEAASRLTLIMA